MADLKAYVRKNWNVPNALTLLRLLLVPVYVILFANGRKWWALAVFLIASLTDMLDGRIARKYNLITDFGKLMDPLADKVMVITALLSMTIGNAFIPGVIPWAVVIIVAAKELIMVVGGALLLKRGIVVHSVFIGKAATCAFIAGLVASYFHEQWAALCPGWPLTPDLILLWLAVVLTLAALATYGVHAARSLKEGHF